MRKSYLKRSALFSAISLSIFALTTSSAHSNALQDTTLSMDANVEINTDAFKHDGESSQYDQSGFVEVNFMGERRFNEYFARAKGTARLLDDGDVITQDMYFMFGTDYWDIQAGRFEARNLFPLGKDTLVIHAGSGEAQVYEANLVRGRVDDGGQFAWHVRPSDSWEFELATQFGGGDKTTAFSGIRPALTYKAGPMNLTLGLERQKFETEAGEKIHKEGYALTSTINLDNTVYNVSFAQMKDKESTSIDKVSSIGANVTHGPFGAGVIHSQTDRVDGDNPELTTAYVAYTLPLFDIKDASVTFAGSLSKASDVSAAASDSSSGLRMRFNYTF